MLNMCKLGHMITSLGNSDFTQSLTEIIILNAGDECLREAENLTSKASLKTEVLSGVEHEVN